MRLMMAGLFALAATATSFLPGQAGAAETIKIGSKNFTEQFIVAELYAGALEGAGYRVERKINLGATLVAHEALRTGAIDLYPEYTGTGVLAVMKATGKQDTDPKKIFAQVRAFYEREFNLTWLAPSRINNGYAIVVRPETAQEFGLKTLSDHGRVSANLKLGAGSEFFDRYDGLPGLKEVYDITFAQTRQFAALRLRYEALTQKQVDVANGFSTDWQIAAEKFRALDDDKNLFPPYELAPVVRAEIARDTKLVETLARVNALIDNATMQELNRQVEVDKREPRRVAGDFLKQKGITN